VSFCVDLNVFRCFWNFSIFSLYQNPRFKNIILFKITAPKNRPKNGTKLTPSRKVQRVRAGGNFSNGERYSGESVKVWSKNIFCPPRFRTLLFQKRHFWTDRIWFTVGEGGLAHVYDPIKRFWPPLPLQLWNSPRFGEYFAKFSKFRYLNEIEFFRNLSGI